MRLAPGPLPFRVLTAMMAFYVIAIGAQQGFGAELAGVHHVLARCDVPEAPRGEGRGEEPNQTTTILVPLRPALNHGCLSYLQTAVVIEAVMKSLQRYQQIQVKKSFAPRHACNSFFFREK